jgi:HK97 family phage major capsid protein
MADSLTNASTLTRDQVEAVLVAPLHAASVVLSSGPKIIDVAEGKSLRIPTIREYSINSANAASPNYAWVPENTAIGEADPNYDEVVLLPNTLRSLKIGHKMSNELARHGVVDVLSAVGSEAIRQVALALDQAFLTGDGSNNTPLGLTEQPDTTTDSGSVASDDLLGFHGTLLAANTTPNTWFMSPANFTTLRTERAIANGSYLVQPDPTAANLYRFAGLPIAVSTNVPDDVVILADTRDIVVARDKAASVEIFRETYAASDQVYLRITARYDIGLLHPASVGILSV